MDKAADTDAAYKLVLKLVDMIPEGELFNNAGVSVDVISGPYKGETVLYSQHGHENFLDVAITSRPTLELLAALLTERKAWRQFEEQRRGVVASVDSKGKRQACRAYRDAKERTEAAIARLVEAANA